jgi:AcrR family transcriptional regulator
MSERRKKKSKKTEKGDQTRAAILEAALAILQERGYEQTTMRAVAERAGVALGNAYYYFHSKEHLIQVFYQRLHDEHVAKSQPLLDKERTLKARLLGVMRLKIETLTPYHQFAGVLFKTAADPESPLNPFAEESDPIREASMRLFEQVVEGSKARIPNDLGRTSLSDLGLSRGRNPLLDSRPFAEAAPHLSFDRSHGGDVGPDDLARE